MKKVLTTLSLLLFITLSFSQTTQTKKEAIRWLTENINAYCKASKKHRMWEGGAHANFTYDFRVDSNGISGYWHEGLDSISKKTLRLSAKTIGFDDIINLKEDATPYIHLYGKNKEHFILILCTDKEGTISAFKAIINENIAEATRLARLPLRCIAREFPNNTAHLSDSSTDAVLLPSQLHPSFYGCLDWHSSVHGHWMLVKILKQFPDIPIRDSIIQLLANSFQEQKIKAEAEYFTKYSTTKIFERTYGWAWLLKLDEELYTWDSPLAKQWHQVLQPLTKRVVELWKTYLLKETYPNRTGVHPNTAFGLAFALDWAKTLKDTAFANAIIGKSKKYYFNNVATPAYLEPDGTDFLSPSLEIADLMRRVLPKQEFIKWINRFYDARDIKRITEMPVVSDRTDFKLVHLDGLIISRAWCMKGIALVLPDNHPWKKIFEKTSRIFLKQALNNVASENYGGDHWLASFLVYALGL